MLKSNWISKASALQRKGRSVYMYDVLVNNKLFETLEQGSHAGAEAVMFACWPCDYEFVFPIKRTLTNLLNLSA